jgi:hypothetical protein
LLDVFAAQMTLGVLDKFKKLNYITSFIPRGYIGYIQVLDIALNKPLKELIKQAASNHYNANLYKWAKGKYIVRDRQVLLTKWVAIA